MINKTSQKIKAMLIGGVVGDALGVPYEFSPRDPDAADMVGYRTYNQPAGTWSDDTSLTLALMEYIMEQGSPKDLMHKFVSYQEQGKYTPYGKMFDIGIATQEAIQRFKTE